MGYRAKRKIFTLHFEDPELEGLEVRVQSVSMGRMLELADQAAVLQAGGADALREVRELLDTFIDRLESWNLENEEGEPTPRTVEGLLEHEVDLVLDMVLTWFHSMIGVGKADPLDDSSTSGDPSLEASMPMVYPSASLTN